MISTLVGAETGDSGEAWVDAAPFRAHLRHLMAVSGLTFPCVAVLTGVSPRLAYRLLYGRRGRALRRISPDTARKLLRVSAAEARAVSRRTVPAHATVLNIRRLRTAGCSSAGAAEALGLPLSDVAALESGSVTSCSHLVALRAAAAVSLLQTPLAAAPGWASDAA